MKLKKKMVNKIILASKSKVRKKILEENGISCLVKPANVDEDLVKESLLKEGATPDIISKNLAELKANKISQKSKGEIVLGADSIINLNETIISKPFNRNEALKILQKLNGKRHHLISSVCISKNGSMIWNYTDKAALTMKEMTIEQLKAYLSKIKDEVLYAYNVYQIESEGRSLFSKIEGDEDTIMGLPIKQIKKYLNTL
jgi:septum formation protein